MSVHPSYRVGAGLNEWALDVLSRRVYAVLSTINRDGSTHTIPVGFTFDGERFVIPSGSGTRKVRNIERDPRVRMLVQAPPQAMGGDGWVAADGTGAIVRGEAARERVAEVNSRYLTEAGQAVYEEVIGPIMDLAIIVTPERWQTWTDSMMFEPILERGYSEEEMAGWFLPPDQ